MEAQLSTGIFISEIFLVEKKGRTEASYKPQGPQQFCEDRACLTRLNPARGMDDQAGFKGCIPPGPNPQGVPISPLIPLGAEDISVCMPPIWVDISPMGVHKDNETSSGEAETDGHSSDRILRRHNDHAPHKGGNFADHSPGMPDIRSPGVDGQHGEISAYSTAGNRVSRVPGELSLSTPGIPN